MGKNWGTSRVDQLKRELFEEARRELDEILAEKEIAPKQKSRPPPEAHGVVLYGPVTIQRMILRQYQQRTRDDAPLRSENYDLAWH